MCWRVACIGVFHASMRLTSTAFTDGGDIPAKYTCDGANVSPPLAWTDAPARTQSFALIVEDLLPVPIPIFVFRDVSAHRRDGGATAGITGTSAATPSAGARVGPCSRATSPNPADRSPGTTRGSPHRPRPSRSAGSSCTSHDITMADVRSGSDRFLPLRWRTSLSEHAHGLISKQDWCLRASGKRLASTNQSDSVARDADRLPSHCVEHRRHVRHVMCLDDRARANPVVAHCVTRVSANSPGSAISRSSRSREASLHTNGRPAGTTKASAAARRCSSSSVSSPRSTK